MQNAGHLQPEQPCESVHVGEPVFPQEFLYSAHFVSPEKTSQPLQIHNESVGAEARSAEQKSGVSILLADAL